MLWSQAGTKANIHAAGKWWASVPKEQWPHSPELHAFVSERWREPHGDRRQELVYIGVDVDRAKITAVLDACLLTDAEMTLFADGQLQDASDPFAA